MKLIYMNNVVRKTIKEMDYSSINRNTFENDILQYFEEAGYTVKNGTEGLQILKNNAWYPFNIDLIDDEEVSIVYSEIVKPDNAQEFDRENGIVYYINTSEKPHLKFPHVHAEYSGETISISLVDFSVTGNYKTKSKEKEAVKFVKKNRKKLMTMWKKITKG